MLVLLPVYLGLLGLEKGVAVTFLSAAYMLLIGFLMVSNIPTWSGKRAGKRISRSMVVPVMIGLILAVVVLFSYPWLVLSLVAIGYLATIPFSMRDFARRQSVNDI